MSANKPQGAGTFRDDNWQPKDIEVTATGRYPANVMHDGSDDVQEIFADKAHYFYCPKANKKDRDEGMDGFAEQKWVQFQTGNGASGKASSISEGRNTAYKNIHPTVKPTELMRYLCRLVTPKGGIVLDPFMGSGSTGKAAILEGFHFVGIELDPDYFEIACARIEKAVKDKQKELF